MDEYRSRPDDELVEPLFAGLGVSEDPPESPATGRRRPILWLVVLVILAGLIAWWMA